MKVSNTLQTQSPSKGNAFVKHFLSSSLTLPKQIVVLFVTVVVLQLHRICCVSLLAVNCDCPLKFIGSLQMMPKTRKELSQLNTKKSNK